MRHRLMLAAAALLWVAAAAAQPTFAPREEDATAYPDLPGRDEAFGFCAACHAFKLVATQGMTRDRWDSSLAWMTEKHGMPPLDAADRAVILDYLAAAFPPKAPAGGRAGWTSPFAPR